MPDAPTPLDLDAIRARSDARRDYADERPESLHVPEDYAALADESAADVPRLVAEVERLRAEVARLEEDLSDRTEDLAEATHPDCLAPAWDEEAARESALKRAYRVRRTPIHEDDAWAFGEGVRAGIDAMLDLWPRASPTPLPREECVVRLYVWRSPWGYWLVTTVRKERHATGSGRSYHRSQPEAFADAWARTHPEVDTSSH